ncbi:MAG TPA: MFS transporter [Acidimicrobiales bacterium]|nr:MFS transporter [Acidimicrobiales bacterium]
MTATRSPDSAAPSAAGEPPPGETAAIHPPRVAVVVGVLSLAVFMSSLDLFIVNLAFPTITKAFRGSGLGSLAWVLNAYTIVFAAVLVPAGRWADRVGRRKILVAGLVVFALGSAACGLAPGVETLIGARVVQAVGAGLMVPASLSLLLAAVPGPARPAAIGSWSAFAALGAAAGPVVGGVLVEASWRWVFWVNLPVAVVAVIASLRLLPESREPGVVHHPDIAGASLLAAGVGLVAYALVEAPSWGWGSFRFVGAVIGGILVLAGTVVRSARHRAPVIELGLLKARSFSGAAGASIIYYAGFGAFVLNSVEFLTMVWHYSPIRAGLAIGPGPLMVLPFARLVAPRLAARIGGPGRVAVIGALLNAGAQILWWAQMTTHPSYLAHLLPAQLIGGAGVGLAIPSLIAAGSASLPPARFGTGSGILNMSRQVGTVLGVAGLVAVLAHVATANPIPGFRAGVLLIVAFFVASAAISGAMIAGVRFRRT